MILFVIFAHLHPCFLIIHQHEPQVPLSRFFRFLYLLWTMPSPSRNAHVASLIIPEFSSVSVVRLSCSNLVYSFRQLCPCAFVWSLIQKKKLARLNIAHRGESSISTSFSSVRLPLILRFAWQIIAVCGSRTLNMVKICKTKISGKVHLHQLTNKPNEAQWP